MDGLSSGLLDDTLTHWFTSGATTVARPTGWFVALYKADPEAGGTEVDSAVDDTAYARQAVSFQAPTGGVTSNTGAVIFPAVVYGSGANAYNVSHMAVVDTAGSILSSGPLTTTVTRNVSENLTFSSGTIQITISRTSS